MRYQDVDGLIVGVDWLRIRKLGLQLMKTIGKCLGVLLALGTGRTHQVETQGYELG
ncbi:hypothetical protein ABH908_000186 [Pseudomonas frederiksbergensis]|uniref:hypothetical protein n=1 Tax=Pseudomonas TaxID=286 RepID=UPI003D23788D